MEITTQVLIVGSATLFATYIVWGRLSRRKLPPCPARGIPVLGNLLSIDPVNFTNQAQKWREEVGDIFRLHLGSTLMVVLNGYDAIKEALINKADDFSHRPWFYNDWAMGYQESGIIMHSGAGWKEQRGTTLSILRSLGMGKNVMADIVSNEVLAFCSILETFKGEPRDIHLLTNQSTCNVICSLLIGERFEYDDPSFQKIIWIMNYNLQHLLSPASAFLQCFPIFHYVPGDLFGQKIIEDNRREFSRLFTNKFKEQKGEKEFKEGNTDSVIGKYMVEINAQKKNGGKTTINDKNLCKVIEDLMGAGTETTSTTINWFILFLMHYPDIQKKIFQEIDSQIGEKLPCLADRNRLKYLNAAIMETQRLGNVTPLALNHETSKDVDLMGFRIPKGTTIVPNLTSVFNDKSIWGDDVNEFVPERFLDADGNLKQFDEFIPFSLGKRACLGEGLAKMELFLYTSTLCQRFEFLAPDPENLPGIHNAVVNITRSASPYEVRIVNRRT